MYVQFCMPLFTTWRYNNNLHIRYPYHTTILNLSYNSARVNSNNSSIDLCNEDLQITTVFFTTNSSSHKADWIITTCLLCLTHLYAQVWCRFSVERTPEFYCDYIVLCVLWLRSHTCLSLFLSFNKNLKQILCIR